MGRRVVLKEEALSVTFLIRNAVFKLKLHSCAVGRSLGVCVGENGAPEPIPDWMCSHFGSVPPVCEAVLLCRQQPWVQVSPAVPGSVCPVAAGPRAGLGCLCVSCWSRSGGHMEMVFDVVMCAPAGIGSWAIPAVPEQALLPAAALASPEPGFGWEAQMLTEAGLVCFANCCLLSFGEQNHQSEGNSDPALGFYTREETGNRKNSPEGSPGLLTAVAAGVGLAPSPP